MLLTGSIDSSSMKDSLRALQDMQDEAKEELAGGKKEKKEKQT